MEEIELTRTVPEAPELAYEFAFLGVLDDAGVPVTVRQQEATVREEGELGRPTVRIGPRVRVRPRLVPGRGVVLLSELHH